MAGWGKDMCRVVMEGAQMPLMISGGETRCTTAVSCVYCAVQVCLALFDGDSISQIQLDAMLRCKRCCTVNRTLERI